MGNFYWLVSSQKRRPHENNRCVNGDDYFWHLHYRIIDVSSINVNKKSTSPYNFDET